MSARRKALCSGIYERKSDGTIINSVRTNRYTSPVIIPARLPSGFANPFKGPARRSTTPIKTDQSTSPMRIQEDPTRRSTTRNISENITNKSTSPMKMAESLTSGSISSTKIPESSTRRSTTPTRRSTIPIKIQDNTTNKPTSPLKIQGSPTRRSTTINISENTTNKYTSPMKIQGSPTRRSTAINISENTTNKYTSPMKLQGSPIRRSTTINISENKTNKTTSPIKMPENSPRRSTNPMKMDNQKLIEEPIANSGSNETYDSDADYSKNVKFIGRNDILVYIDNESCGDLADKMFTIITTTEDEWAILKKLFKNECEPEKEFKRRKTPIYAQDILSDESDNETEKNKIDENDALNTERNRKSANIQTDCEEYNESVNSINEKEIKKIDYTQTNINPSKENDNCAVTGNCSRPCNCEKNFIRDNILLVTNFCNDNKKTISNKAHCSKLPIENEKDCDKENLKEPRTQTVKNAVIKKCNTSETAEPKPNQESIRKSSQIAPKLNSCKPICTFGLTRKTSLVPPDPPGRPIYVAHRAQRCEPGLISCGTRTCNSEANCPYKVPCQSEIKAHDIAGKRDTTYQRDYRDPYENNSITNRNYNNRNYNNGNYNNGNYNNGNYNNLNYNDGNCNNTEFQYSSPEYFQYEQKQFPSCPIRVNAVNLRTYTNPQNLQEPSRLVHYSGPYM